MKVEVTELGPVKRSLKIEVPQEDVNKQYAEVYAELNRQVRIPGFRPGKAPQALLEQRYGKDVGDDVVRRLIPTFYEKAIRQAGIVPLIVEVPPIERVKIKKDAPFSFTAGAAPSDRVAANRAVTRTAAFLAVREVSILRPASHA